MKVAPLAPPGASRGVLHYGEWYTIKLAGSTLPGKWTLTAGGVLLKVDHKKKGGVDGANSVFHGLTGTEKFEAEGEQINDDERQAVADLLSQIVPQPGTSQNQFPLQLQCPHVAVFGFAIFVKILGSSPFLHIGPCRTKVKLFMEHWLPAKASAPSATNQPTRGKRKFQNTITGQPTKGATPPASQPGAFGPPAKLS
jgi:hypothetical protein